MNVSLTPELERFVAKEVNSGMYQTASEVIRAGLRRLKTDREARKSTLPLTREELEADLAEGVASLRRGEGLEVDEVFRRLEKRIRRAGARG